MRVVEVDPGAPAPEALAEAVAVLERGGVVAFPTETVYGLCVDGSNREAVARLYAAKGRDANRACALLLPDRDAVLRFAGGLPRIAARIADAFWPGPVTLVVPNRERKAVGLRLPGHPLARALAAATARPLMQTSANRSGEPPALDAAGVRAALEDHVDLVLDGGPSPGGTSSTVVGCDGRAYAVLRAGAVPAAEIDRVAAGLTLVVCTGNICRSPLAAAMLEREVAARLGVRAAELGRVGHRFGSFGTMALEGNGASDHTRTVAQEYGLDVSGHRARPFSLALVREAERIYCLARAHYDFLLPYFDQRPEALQLLDPDGKDIEDPYGRSLRVYRRVGERIEEACRRRAEELGTRLD